MNSKEFPYYWICEVCADERGGKWPKGHCATVVQDTCKYCNGKKQEAKYIVPWVDFDWPGKDTTKLRD